jgi:outer membrane receptor for ferrienterochelin and colicin
VIIVAGVRMDSHDLWGEEYNPKLNVLYNVTDRIKLRAGVGRAFNAPSLSKLYAQWRMGPYMVQPNPDLKPETSIGYEVGADIALTKRVDLGVTFFRNEVENLIISTYTRSGPPPWDLEWINVDEAITQGVEVDFKADITDRFSLALGYTYLEARDEKTELDLVQRPKHKADLEAAYRHKDLGLTFVLNGEYVGTRFSDTENTIELEEYTVWDLSVSKDLGDHAQAFIRLENLFGEDDVDDEYDLDGIGVVVGMRTYF